MQFIKKCKQYLTKPLNNCIKSGCVDIIAVESSDHQFNCTPFYIRLSVTDCFHSQSKLQMVVNGIAIDHILVEVGQQGELYFLDYQIQSQKASKTKRIRLTSTEIQSLNLKKGRNHLQFKLLKLSQIQFNKTNQQFKIIEDQSNTDNKLLKMQCSIWLYSYNQKIFISDIDGTISKSDVIGIIMYLLNSDWTQKNIVSLYQTFNEQNIQPIYLTARSLCTYNITRSYLEKVRQNDKRLPDGPILLNPEDSTNSLKQEFITKLPQKIAFMTDIHNVFNFKNNLVVAKDIQLQNLYQDGAKSSLSKVSRYDLDGYRKITNVNDNPNIKQNDDYVQPFVAAFGNRATDAIAYRMAGITLDHIFIVNEKGELIRMSDPNQIIDYQHLQHSFFKYFGSDYGQVFSDTLYQSQMAVDQ